MDYLIISTNRIWTTLEEFTQSTRKSCNYKDSEMAKAYHKRTDMQWFGYKIRFRIENKCHSFSPWSICYLKSEISTTISIYLSARSNSASTFSNKVYIDNIS